MFCNDVASTLASYFVSSLCLQEMAPFKAHIQDHFHPIQYGPRQTMKSRCEPWDGRKLTRSRFAIWPHATSLRVIVVSLLYSHLVFPYVCSFCIYSVLWVKYFWESHKPHIMVLVCFQAIDQTEQASHTYTRAFNANQVLKQAKDSKFDKIKVC